MAKGQRKLQFTFNNKFIDDLTQAELAEVSAQYPKLVERKYQVNYKHLKSAWDAGLLTEESLIDISHDEEVSEVALAA